MAEKVTGTKVPDSEAVALLGEGVHTGLRKGTEAPSAVELWETIGSSHDGAWEDAVRFAVYGLGVMGYAIVKVDSDG